MATVPKQVTLLVLSINHPRNQEGGASQSHLHFRLLTPFPQPLTRMSLFMSWNENPPLSEKYISVSGSEPPRE